MKKQQVNVVLTAVITTIIVILGFFLLMPIIGPRYLHPMMMGNQPTPSNLDTSTSQLSDAGLFQISWSSDSDVPPLNQIHIWTLHVETADGQPVEGATILVDGGMPQHGHGLPTSPEVTEDLGNGDYRVEGMKFQMPGFWEVRFNINADGQSDTITFNLILK
jgi:hypothetical protein